MDESFKQECQESLLEWNDIERKTAIREKKDKKIISIFCANNKSADICGIVELLLKHNGMPSHDLEVVNNFKRDYPEKLTVKLINDFLDIKDIYSSYLESGGEYDD